MCGEHATRVREMEMEIEGRKKRERKVGKFLSNVSFSHREKKNVQDKIILLGKKGWKSIIPSYLYL